MKLQAHPVNRRLSALAHGALLSCLIGLGAYEAVAQATTSRSLTQAQKLSSALHACKKQPHSKQAACRKRAKKKYGTHHAGTPTPPGTTPTTPTTPAGSVAPAGPTLAWLQQQLCASPACDPINVISN